MTSSQRGPFRPLAGIALLTAITAACAGGTPDGAISPGPVGSGPQHSGATPASTVTTGTETPTSGPIATTRAPGTTVPPVRKPRAATTYDNTLASEACRLLSVKQIEQAFGGPVGEPMPVDPFCQWSIGSDAWISLEIHQKPLGAFRSAWGAAPVANATIESPSASSSTTSSTAPTKTDSSSTTVAASERDEGYFANNKALVFGKGDRTYVLGWQKSGTWDDRARPKQVAAAASVLENLAAPLAPPPEVKPAPAVDVKRTPSEDDPLRLWVGGDSLAGGPSWAIGDQLDRTGLVRSQREFHVGSGLSNRDFLDWRAHLQAEIDAYRSEVVILMFGANDGLPLTANGTTVWPEDPRWNDAYRQRVDDLLDVAATDGRVVMWVGLPPMQDPKLSASVEQANKIVAETVGKRADAFFVDIWSMFSAPGSPGAYTNVVSANGTDVVVRLDGIHLNTDGSIVLARHLYPLLKERGPGPPHPILNRHHAAP